MGFLFRRKMSTSRARAVLRQVMTVLGQLQPYRPRRLLAPPESLIIHPNRHFPGFSQLLIICCNGASKTISKLHSLRRGFRKLLEFPTITEKKNSFKFFSFGLETGWGEEKLEKRFFDVTKWLMMIFWFLHKKKTGKNRENPLLYFFTTQSWHIPEWAKKKNVKHLYTFTFIFEENRN